MIDGFRFEIEVGGGRGARLGRLTTPRGVISTPAFLPVATRGAVKGVLPGQLRELGAQILLANTYHLAVRPGEGVVRRLGGLHAFSGWDGPILTDSGGFQVLSLAGLRRIDDDGVEFRSHVDGALIRLEPERVVDIQATLGSDIAMVLDQCPGPEADRAAQRTAVERTVAWARRSAHARAGAPVSGSMALFAIQQGGPHEDLRAECAERLLEVDREGPAFDGFAVGGVSVGEDRDRLLATIPVGARALPGDRPRYLMGVSGFQEYAHAIEAGIDLFDCVLPTRNARNGTLFTRSGERVRIRNRRYRDDPRPIDAGCDCLACQRFSRGFLQHLILRGEMLGATLASLHNLRVFHAFLEAAREALRAGRWAEFATRGW